MLLKSHAPRWNKPFLVNVLYWRPLSLIKYSASHLYIYFFRKALKEGSFSKNELSPCSVSEPDQCWPQKDDFLLCRKRMFGLCWPVSRYSQIPRPSAPFAWICPSILHSNIQTICILCVTPRNISRGSSLQVGVIISITPVSWLLSIYF